jgi:toxin-antitoxin system toxin component
MQTTKEILEQLRVYKAAKADVYGIETLGLFGSAARGEQQEDSDIDVCVKLKEADFFKRMSIQEDLESIFSRKVDVVSLGAIMRPFFKKTLERDAIFV